MNHYFYKIYGWFKAANLFAQMVRSAKNNSHFVEIGAWLGSSTTFMAVEIINSGKNIKFDSIDTWKGSEEHKNEEVVVNDTLYNDYLKNIEPVKHMVNPIRLPSIEAAELYEDNSLDFVFIDGSHDYENVKNDINAWYPKVKSGGILAGDDYDIKWSGVIKASNEFAKQNNYQLTIDDEFCWNLCKK
jgi:hypothetical protein